MKEKRFLENKTNFPAYVEILLVDDDFTRRFRQKPSDDLEKCRFLPQPEGPTIETISFGKYRR
jgi:hypothetical protein